MRFDPYGSGPLRQQIIVMVRAEGAGGGVDVDARPNAMGAVFAAREHRLSAGALQCRHRRATLRNLRPRGNDERRPEKPHGKSDGSTERQEPQEVTPPAGDLLERVRG